MGSDKDWALFMGVLVGIGILIGFGLFIVVPWLWRLYAA